MEARASQEPSAADGVVRYDGTAIAFHWVTAALIVIVGALGLLHDSWPRQTQSFWIDLHAMVGLVVWALIVARLWWRRTHTHPNQPTDAGVFSLRVSGPLHLLIYLLIFTIPIFGVATFIWHGRVFDFGLFRLDVGIRKNFRIFHPTEEIHGYLAYALFAVAAIHTLAALWHYYFRRDGMLSRMWPTRRRHPSS